MISTTVRLYATRAFHSGRRCHSVFSRRLTGPQKTINFRRKCSAHKVDLWNPKLYTERSDFVVNDGIKLLNQLQPRPGERILDLGCGTGEVTAVLQNAGINVVGVDSSLSMVEAAKARGVDAFLVDSRYLDFKEEFDAVFSNMALHWMPEDPERVVKNIASSLRKSGRFVAEFIGEGGMSYVRNPTRSVLKRHGLSDAQFWYTPSLEEFAQLLESEGLQVKHSSLFPREYRVRGGPKTWLDLYGSKLLVGVDDFTKRQIYDEVEQAVDPARIDEEGCFLGNGVVINVSATKAI